MSLYESDTYLVDLDRCIDQVRDLDRLIGASVLVTGANGCIASFLVDVLGRMNERFDADITIHVGARSKTKLEERFADFPFPGFEYCEYEAGKPIMFDFPVDMVVHAASNAHPQSITADPLGTIAANVTGVGDLLAWSESNGCKRFLFVSSGEIYGQLPEAVLEATEHESGYLDPLIVRSSYPLSKRMGENLCVSFGAQSPMEVVIARLSHTFGPTAAESDSRAHAQFLFDGANGNAIVLKSAGSQFRSYSYIVDAVSGLLTILLCAEDGRAYNVANPASRVSIRGFAEEVARLAGIEVRYELDEETLRKGSRLTRQVLSSKALEELGWMGVFDLTEGIRHSLAILDESADERK